MDAFIGIRRFEGNFIPLLRQQMHLQTAILAILVESARPATDRIALLSVSATKLQLTSKTGKSGRRLVRASD